MPSIPDSFIDEVRERVDLVALIGRYINLKKAGSRYTGVCPFHGDTDPSLSVNPDRGFWYCFGCQAGGDAISFVRQKEGLEFVEAIEFLARMHGLSVPMATGEQVKSRTKILYDINELASGLFQKYFKSKHGRNFREYLKGRGFRKETILLYKIGASPPGWRFLATRLAERGFEDDALVETGLVMRNKSGRLYDRFRNRLLIPIIDNLDRVSGFGGRAMGDDSPKYVNSPESKIFHKSRILFGINQAKDAAKEKSQLLVMEGYTDVMHAHQAGLKNSCAVMGTALTEEHIPILSRFAEEVILVFDGDEAGRRATIRSLHALANVDFRIRVLSLPSGEDPADIITRKGGDELRQLVDKAPPGSEWILNLYAEPVRNSDLMSKLKTLSSIGPYIVSHENSAIREELIERAAMAFSTPLSAVRDVLAKIRTGNTENVDKADPDSLEAIVHGIERAERTFFLAIIANPEYVAEVRELVSHRDFEYPLHRKLAGIILETGFNLSSPESVTKQREVYEDRELYGFVIGLITELDRLKGTNDGTTYTDVDLKRSLHTIIRRQYENQTSQIQEKMARLQAKKGDSDEFERELLSLMSERQSLETSFRKISEFLDGDAI